MYPKGCDRPAVEYNMYLVNDDGIELDHAAISPNFSYGIIAYNGLPAGKYTLKIKNWNDDKAMSDYVISTYAKKEVAI